MSAPNGIYIPECITVQRTVTVPNDICVLEIVPSEAGARLGQLAPLPKGARLEICGDGFNDRAVKARYAGRFFFVFLRDLDSTSSETLGVEAS